MSESKPKGKPFAISKRLVWEAWLRVKANRGAAGVDEQSIQAFEANLTGNLYKLWNRLCSGSYMPPPVRAVEIPKRSGGSRVLGVPTVTDRVAQTVVHLYLEPTVEPCFHPDSYGYRPRRSALDAVRVCRERCWRHDWVIDLDLRSFFDSLDHSLVLRSLARHTSERWTLLYVQRWLEAPLQREDGTLEARDRGSPQGSAISPLLANIYLHYALDLWLAREFPAVPFERYADDVILHCKSRPQALLVLDAITARLAQVGLELNPDKTRIVYCKDAHRNGSHEHERSGRAGARCRRCRRPVSPARPPNRTCPFPSIRLSTGHAVADRGAGQATAVSRPGGGPSCSGGRPRRGDAVAAISVSGHRDLGGPVRASRLRGRSSRAPSTVA